MAELRCMQITSLSCKFLGKGANGSILVRKLMKHIRNEHSEWLQEGGRSDQSLEQEIFRKYRDQELNRRAEFR